MIELSLLPAVSILRAACDYPGGVNGHGRFRRGGDAE
jgi:hypothetical protein